MKRSVLLFSIIFLLAAILSCGTREKISTYSFFMADTYISIKVYDAEDFEGPKLEGELKKYSEQMDRFNKGSVISELNEKGEVEAPGWLAELVRYALDCREKTGGAFDITLGEFSDLWGFTGGDMAMPSAEKIESLLKKERKLWVEGSTIKKENCIVDLGALGKGFLLEKAGKMLLDKGYGKFLLNFGGNVYGIGDREYKVGLQDPRGASGAYYKVINLKNTAVATSGDYRRYFFAGEKRYCHIFDPATGYPADKFQSVSIICDSPLLSDVLSTAVFVGGKESASAYKGIEVYSKP